MAFKLPRLTTDVDCEPIGYPGLVVTFWLNVTTEEWEPPEDAKDWDTLFYHGLGRMIDRVTFPADMVDGDEPEVWEIADGKALYDLMAADGFDQAIIIWSQSQYQDQRQERLQAEVKN
jgi:hypothetical protein